MLDFDKMMTEINKDISESEQGVSPVTLEQQQKKLDESIDKLNKFTDSVNEEFTKKFQEMHEMFFESQSTTIPQDNNSDNEGDIIE